MAKAANFLTNDFPRGNAERLNNQAAPYNSVVFFVIDFGLRRRSYLGNLICRHRAAPFEGVQILLHDHRQGILLLPPLF